MYKLIITLLLFFFICTTTTNTISAKTTPIPVEQNVSPPPVDKAKKKIKRSKKTKARHLKTIKKLENISNQQGKKKAGLILMIIGASLGVLGVAFIVIGVLDPTVTAP